MFSSTNSKSPNKTNSKSPNKTNSKSPNKTNSKFSNGSYTRKNKNSDVKPSSLNIKPNIVNKSPLNIKKNELRILINKPHEWNNEIYKVFVKKYKNNKLFGPKFMYLEMLLSTVESVYLVNDDDEILAECSLNDWGNNVRRIDDVFVEEKYRGNKYATILFNKMIQYHNDNNQYYKYVISAHNYNTPALKTYTSVFGKPDKITKTQTYFEKDLRW
jgi:GNAT superfamily N-acetyltransferase